MDNLVEKIVRLHDALTGADIPHAFGGALALAWCTRRARGTIDIDVNVLLSASEYQRAVDALPDDVSITRDDVKILKRDGQARFLNGVHTPKGPQLHTCDPQSIPTHCL